MGDINKKNNSRYEKNKQKIFLKFLDNLLESWQDLPF